MEIPISEPATTEPMRNLRFVALTALVTCACSSGATRNVDGLAFEGVPAGMTAQCRATARQVGFPVPCPLRLPREAHPTVFAAGNCPGRAVWVGPGCDGESAYSFASIEWPEDARVGHLVIVGAPTEASAAAIISSPLPPDQYAAVRTVGSSHVGASAADVVAVEDSSSTALGGHLVFVWTVDHHTYAFGFHGTDDHARQLDDALAKDMQLVTG